MACYVDAAVWPFGRMMMCHLLADTADELHDMAGRIGVRRKWFQGERYPHYDICKSKRVLAVTLGAIEIDRRRFVEIALVLERKNNESKNGCRIDQGGAPAAN